MKKIFIAILILFSVQSFGQTKLYAVRGNLDGTKDSFYVHEIVGHGIYNSLGHYVAPRVDSINSVSGLEFPLSFGSFFKCADNIYRNFIFPGSEIPGVYRFGIDAGVNDSYVISVTPPPTSYTGGMMIYFRANTINTGAATININGLGVKTIVKRVNTTLANGDILASMICQLMYDGTNFVLLNPIVN